MLSKAERLVRRNFNQRKMIRFYYVLDADRDGHIEEEDYRGCAERMVHIRQLEPTSPDYGRVHQLFQQSWDELRRYADKSGDDRVEMDEWLAYREDIYHGYDAGGDILEDPEAEKWRLGEHMFALLDSDRDGRVTLDDFTTFYAAYRLPADLAQKIFQKLDIQRLGYLTREDVVHRYYEFTHSDDPDDPGNWFFGPF